MSAAPRPAGPVGGWLVRVLFVITTLNTVQGLARSWSSYERPVAALGCALMMTTAMTLLVLAGLHPRWVRAERGLSWHTSVCAAALVVAADLAMELAQGTHAPVPATSWHYATLSLTVAAVIAYRPVREVVAIAVAHVLTLAALQTVGATPPDLPHLWLGLIGALTGTLSGIAIVTALVAADRRREELEQLAATDEAATALQRELAAAHLQTLAALSASVLPLLEDVATGRRALPLDAVARAQASATADRLRQRLVETSAGLDLFDARGLEISTNREKMTGARTEEAP